MLLAGPKLLFPFGNALVVGQPRVIGFPDTPDLLGLPLRVQGFVIPAAAPTLGVFTNLYRATTLLIAGRAGDRSGAGGASAGRAPSLLRPHLRRERWHAVPPAESTRRAPSMVRQRHVEGRHRSGRRPLAEHGVAVV